MEDAGVEGSCQEVISGGDCMDITGEVKVELEADFEKYSYNI